MICFVVFGEFHYLVFQFYVYANIRGDFLERGRQTTMELPKTAIFSTFARYLSEALEVRPTILYSII